MKKYIICSDIHGRIERFEKAFTKNSDADCLLVAGDLQLDSYEITDFVYKRANKKCDVYMVQGNCDAYEPSAGLLPVDLIIEGQCGHKILLTHGHKYRARTDLMSYKAEENGCDIVVFGHIHRFVNEKAGDILFVNPGALNAGDYAVLTIDDEGKISVTSESI